MNDGQCRTRRRRQIASILAVISLATASCVERIAKSDHPSILLITLDTTRADRLGCYGYSRGTSGTLDRLSKRGALFTQAISPSAITPVSHASILTGLYPYSHGLRVMHGIRLNRLPEAQWTLAELLRNSGYDTAAFVSAFPVTKRFGLHQGFNMFDAAFLDTSSGRFVSEDGIVNTAGSQRRADETTDLALDWLGRVEDPFFLWVHYFDPHDSTLLPPKEWRDPVSLTDSKEEFIREIYDLEIRYMDSQIARVLESLEMDGRLDSMIVVVVGDHGEGLGDHEWWTHALLYQEQVRVPLIILGPSRSLARERIDSLVRTIDVMPTILDLAGIPTHDSLGLDGQSLLPLFDDDPADLRLTAYADSLDLFSSALIPGHSEKVLKDEIYFALIDWPWKYIHHEFRPERSELFNLEKDPRESLNLFAEEPARVGQFIDALESIDCRPDRDPNSLTEVMPAEELERLESLGYVK